MYAWLPWLCHYGVGGLLLAATTIVPVRTGAL